MDRNDSPSRSSATAFAPATVANVCVGFDVLGFALDEPGDRITVSLERPGELRVAVEEIRGLADGVPVGAGNTAAVAARSMALALGLEGTLRIVLDKGIPLGSGMGGSAASAVAAVVALAEVAAAAGLARPGRDRLLGWALDGEAAVSGARHADNVAPCLWGGLTAVVADDPPAVVAVPVPDGMRAVVARPHVAVETRAARAALRAEVGLADHVRQTMRLAGFLAGCFRGDAELAGRSLEDVVVGPQRVAAIPGFAAARAAALGAGAIGFGIAGSGPSVFAWVPSGIDADGVAATVRRAVERTGVGCDAWVGRAGGAGARILPTAGAHRG